MIFSLPSAFGDVVFKIGVILGAQFVCETDNSTFAPAACDLFELLLFKQKCDEYHC